LCILCIKSWASICIICAAEQLPKTASLMHLLMCTACYMGKVSVKSPQISKSQSRKFAKSQSLKVSKPQSLSQYGSFKQAYARQLAHMEGETAMTRHTALVERPEGKRLKEPIFASLCQSLFARVFASCASCASAICMFACSRASSLRRNKLCPSIIRNPLTKTLKGCF